MIENIQELAKFVKGGAEVLQKAIESKENVSLELVDGSFVSDDELNSLKDERFNAGKKEGNTIGYDFALKDIKKDFGIELEGKDRKEIVKAVQSKIMSDAKIEPDKKISDLNTSLENLRKQYETDKTNWENQELSYKGKLKDISIMSELQKQMPGELKGLKSNQFAVLARQEYNFDFDEDGSFIVKKGKEVLKDKMERPIPPKNILTDFATQNGWLSVEGRGNGDSTGGSSSKFESMNDVMKHMHDNKINPMSDEGQKMMNDFKNSKD